MDFNLFLFKLLNLFSPKNVLNINLWGTQRNGRAFKKYLNVIFAHIIFEILLFNATLVSRPARHVTGNQRVKISEKNPKNVWLLLENLEK